MCWDCTWNTCNAFQDSDGSIQQFSSLVNNEQQEIQYSGLIAAPPTEVINAKGIG